MWAWPHSVLSVLDLSAAFNTLDNHIVLQRFHTTFDLVSLLFVYHIYISAHGFVSKPTAVQYGRHWTSHVYCLCKATWSCDSPLWPAVSHVCWQYSAPNFRPSLPIPQTIRHHSTNSILSNTARWRANYRSTREEKKVNPNTCLRPHHLVSLDQSLLFLSLLGTLCNLWHIIVCRESRYLCKFIFLEVRVLSVTSSRQRMLVLVFSRLDYRNSMLVDLHDRVFYKLQGAQHMLALYSTSDRLIMAHHLCTCAIQSVLACIGVPSWQVSFFSAHTCFLTVLHIRLEILSRRSFPFSLPSI